MVCSCDFMVCGSFYERFIDGEEWFFNIDERLIDGVLVVDES